jgi:hypothetical protein
MCWIRAALKGNFISLHLYGSETSTAAMTFEPRDPKRKQASVDVNREVGSR